jgi:hypothetical protein
MGELLKEAMADAKAIRETALANAKMALEEAFAPQLEKMISDKIHRDVMGEEGEEGEEELGGEEEAPVVAAEPGAEVEVEPGAEAEIEPEVPAEAPEIEVPAAEVGGEEGEEEGELELQEGGAGTKVTSDADADPEKAKGSKTTINTLHEEDEEEDQDLDLESIIRELEEEAEEDEEEDDVDEVVQFGGKVTGDAGQDPEQVKGKNKPYKGGKEDMAAIKEGEEEEVDEKKEVDEKIAKYKISKPPANPVKEGEEEVEEKIEKYPSLGNAIPSGVRTSESAEEEIDLDEILKELEAEESAEEVDEKKEEGEEEDVEEALAAENAQLKAQLGTVSSSLEEHRKAVSILKSRLNEVNLLNAKLLFTNKLFKSHTLNNAQKMKVIESFDRAKNLREVKLLYATMAESWSQTDLVKKSEKTVKKITEGMASKTQKSTKPAVEKVVKESSIIDDGSAERLKKLAGIIK